MGSTRIGLIHAAVALSMQAMPVMAQSGPQAANAASYECAANASCSIVCTVDGEKIVQTGSPKTVTVKPLAPNNYLVELVEQNGKTQYAYLAGVKVVCSLQGLTRHD